MALQTAFASQHIGKFDFIGKLENADQDWFRMLQKSGLSSDVLSMNTMLAANNHTSSQDRDGDQASFEAFLHQNPRYLKVKPWAIHYAPTAMHRCAQILPDDPGGDQCICIHASTYSIAIAHQLT